MNRFFPVSLLALVLVFSGCQKESVPASQQATQQGAAAAAADFSRYIAVGNSLSAGYADNGLYRDGQLVSFPNLIATQMKAVGGGDFFQPLFTPEQANGSGYLRLAGLNADGTPNIIPVTDKLAIRGSFNVPGYGTIPLYTKYSGELNNYGVPGLKLQEILTPLVGNLNPYFERLLPNPPGLNNISYLNFVTAKPYTFFSNWLGSNDALLYALSGGEGDVLTDTTQFALIYTQLLTTLTKNGAGGVVANIVDFASIPYFNTVTVKALVTFASRISASNVYINALDPATGRYAPRAATDADLVVLGFNPRTLGTSANGTPGYGITLSNPIESSNVLDAAEVALSRRYINAYNRTIRNTATLYGLAFFDAQDFLNRVKSGMVVNGVFVNSDYITGGVFSLDGVHVTPRGNALLGNEFIKAINQKYSTAIPLLDVSAYKGVL